MRGRREAIVSAPAELLLNGGSGRRELPELLLLRPLNGGSGRSSCSCSSWTEGVVGGSPSFQLLHPAKALAPAEPRLCEWPEGAHRASRCTRPELLLSVTTGSDRKEWL
ncbi:hypothetical protein ZWY2020_019275 [Hordeum vulgare]|nr:hypothetical protein ZWY2020_015002 [Hordeum vulgare]KAI4986645.1 hypothetical protein ZWY2020_019275 [Hordeum vulgare]